MKMKTSEELQAYIDTKSEFSDFTRFRDSNEKRKQQRDDFLQYREYAPRYDYPDLDTFRDGTTNSKNETTFIADKKTKIYEAVMELRANRDAGELSPEVYDLYAGYHEVRLKKIMLVEAMQRLRTAGSSSEQQVTRQEVNDLNVEIYGEFDAKAFEGIMNTEEQRVRDFSPSNKRASEIKDFLDTYMNRHSFDEEEKLLLDDEMVHRLQDFIYEKQADMLAVFPETDDSVTYTACEARDIMQKSLDVSGLGEKGWKIEVSSNHPNVSTNSAKKTIFLPDSMTRTSAELQRLDVHERGVHATRNQNGRESGVPILRYGTADYADVEEGMGVFLECAVAGNLDNPSYHRARDRYITTGLALGIDRAPKDANQTHAIMWRLLAVRNSVNGEISNEDVAAAKEKSMNYIDNAFRGTDYVSQGVIFSKLKVYYEGLVKNAKYFSENRDHLDEAFTVAMRGKYNHTDPEERSAIERLIDQQNSAKERDE